MTEIERIPLRGMRAGEPRERRGLKIRSSDCETFAPPKHVNDKHREIHKMIDRRKVRDGEVHGWIEHDGKQVTNWYVDEDLL